MVLAICLDHQWCSHAPRPVWCAQAGEAGRRATAVQGCRRQQRPVKGDEKLMGV